MVYQTVILRSLKAFAAQRLVKFSITREIVLKEPDELTAEDYLGRIRAWLNILETERGAERSG